MAVASVATAISSMPTTRMKKVAGELSVSTFTPWAPAGMAPALVTSASTISVPGAPGVGRTY